MTHAQTQIVLNDRPARRFFASVVVLFKFRIVILLLFASIGGLMLAAHGRPDMADLLLLTLTGTMSAAGASALNQVLELESDARMRRTQRRPMARGEYRPAPVVAVSLALVAGAVALALAAGNLTLAFFLGLGAFIYIVIYTVVLKPRTPLNIVLGGAAGSCAVLAGSAAAGNWADPGAVLLAALVFAWTPTHFWSLSLVYREDYVRAGVPMLPAVVEAPRAAFWMLVHALFTGGIALLMVAHESLGLIYLVPVGLATASLVRGSLRLFRRPERDQAIEVFKGSNLYLAVALLAICVDTLLVL